MSLNVHAISCDSDPTSAPTAVNQHWTNTTTGEQWFSNGTASVANWIKQEGDTDIKVKVSANDSTAAFLDTKITSGSGITITELNDGSNESLEVKIDSSSVAENTFKTINTPSGTNPVADSSTDTLNLTSADSSVVITGNSSTDTVDLVVDDSKIDHTLITNVGTNTHAQIDTHIANTNNPHSTKFYKTVTVPSGTNPTADTVDDTLNLTSSDSSVVITGTASSDTVDFKAKDEKVKVSSNDTTPGDLITKLQPGSNVTITENNDGSNETITIAATGSLTADVAVAQGRRTTTYTATTSYVDINFDTTDEENKPSVVDHDNSDRDRLVAKQAGVYLVYYNFSYKVTSNGVFNTRVRKNDAVEIPGSAVTREDGGDTFVTAKVFSITLAANDFLSLQHKKTSGAGEILSGAVFGMVKLEGAKGDQGDPGSGSTINIAEEGTNLANTPHSKLNFIGSNITATDAGGGTANITVSESVFGKNYEYSESETQTSTTSTSYVDKLSYVSASLPSGNYRIGYSYEVAMDSSGDLASFKVLVGGTTIAENSMESDNDFLAFSGQRQLNLTGSQTIKIQYKTNDNTNAAIMRRARIEIWRVS